MRTFERWLSLWGVEREKAATSTYAKLVSNYLDGTRRYHDLRHIIHCLSEFDQVRHLANDPLVVETGLWCHDVFNDTHRTDNEELSAAFAEAELDKLGMPILFQKRTSSIVIGTKHNVVLTDSDEQLVADIDLSSLGWPWPKFREMDEAIRHEYAWVPQDAYVEGRTKVLQKFLDRPSIYYLTEFRDRYEARARRNLSLSIELLRGEMEQ